MKRVSCILLPMLPLQILLRQKPHWSGAPIAVVDDDGPNGRITHLNALARKSRLQIGMRQTVARDLLPNLHTAVVSPERASKVSQELDQRASDLLTTGRAARSCRRILHRSRRSPAALWQLSQLGDIHSPIFARSALAQCGDRRLSSPSLVGGRDDAEWSHHPKERRRGASEVESDASS